MANSYFDIYIFILEHILGITEDKIRSRLTYFFDLSICISIKCLQNQYTTFHKVTELSVQLHGLFPVFSDNWISLLPYLFLRGIFLWSLSNIREASRNYRSYWTVTHTYTIKSYTIRYFLIKNYTYGPDTILGERQLSCSYSIIYFLHFFIQILKKVKIFFLIWCINQNFQGNYVWDLKYDDIDISFSCLTKFRLGWENKIIRGLRIFSLVIVLNLFEID